jgi:CheY-like chemotaxis protein
MDLEIMKPLVLIVEDNVDLLFNLDLILKSNNYQTIIAKNGVDALEKLNTSNLNPDIIISDILMPKMNGYEFFEKISNDPRWHRVPFIFLSAKATPEDIRLGKLLGADDYITKPFEEKDLLATITGRMNRVQRIEKIDQNLSNFKLDKTEIENIRKENEYLLFVIWDDRLGPELKDFYPKEEKFHIPLDNLANQLFSAVTSIYGQDSINKAEGLLINIKNVDFYGYVYFDAYPSESERYGEKQYMLAFLSPFISYLHSLEIKSVLEEISIRIKENRSWSVKYYWKLLQELIIDILD